MGGVTRTLNISYLRAIPVGSFSSPYTKAKVEKRILMHLAGTTIRIHSEVVQVGRTMAMIRGVMTSLDGKTIYCTCEHHKVNVSTQKDHLKYKVEWDDHWEADGKAKL
jgi:hypothetical protein